MPEELPSIAYVREVKGMISAGIDHQLDGRSLARAPFHPPFAIFGRRPIVKFADQDNGWNSQLIGGNAARRIIGHGGLKLQIIRECKKLDRMRRGQLESDHAALRRPE